MDYEYLINATPFELWKRAEHWEENARFAQEELAELTHRLEEMQDELLSREEAVIGMEAERDKLVNRVKDERYSSLKMHLQAANRLDELASSQGKLKVLWQAEALEEAVNREMSEQFLTYWDVRITAMSLINHAQELRRQAEEE
jgi:predicted DNA-binding protein